MRCRSTLARRHSPLRCVGTLLPCSQLRRVRASSARSGLPERVQTCCLKMQVGEFVEVSNNSKTDPCAWVGVCATVGQKCLIDYPFHDSPSEYIKPHLLRRARVWDDFDWQYIEPGQTWKAGEVTSPLELHLQPELEYFQQLKQFNGRSKVKQESDTDIKQEGSGESEADDQQDSSAQQRKQSVKKRGRPRKPGNPTRSTVDEASNGHDDKKDEKPKGAKRRKPSAVRQA
eukprot:GHRR01008470.1.p1 GENE.GHRR01008470.1~~GHRR01008470.1.p1  ORF type:complete len:230 (+),score=42.74 GHRR01008470.1:358-1047(+)